MKKQKLLNIGETQVVLRKNDLLGNEKKIGIAAKTFTKPDEVIFFAIWFTKTRPITFKSSKSVLFSVVRLM